MNNRFYFRHLLSVMLTIAVCLVSLSSCNNDEPSTKTDGNSSKAKEQLIGAWNLGATNNGLLWFFPNGKCYNGEDNGIWEYNTKNSKVTTTIASMPDITIVEWTDIEQWKGYSDYYGGRLIKAFKRDNERYMDGVWNMIDLQEGYSFPISEFRNIRFPENAIIRDCVIKSGYFTYYASFELTNPYTDNLRFTITYDKLYDDFTSQTFTCGGKWK